MGEGGSSLGAGDTKVTYNPPPTWVTLSVLVTGLVFVGGATMGAYLRQQPAKKSLAPVATSQPTTLPPAAIPKPPVVQAPTAPTAPTDWRSLVMNESCQSPCAGGLQCTDTPKRCYSGLGCVPGTGRERLESDFVWLFRLNAVYETDEFGVPMDPCKTGRDFWVCLGTQCLSQRQACQSETGVARSSDAIRVTGTALTGEGAILEVHDGGPNGSLLATSTPIRDLLRGGLCNAFRVPVQGEGLTRVAYFLTPE
jgi:hypothetical protein